MRKSLACLCVSVALITPLVLRPAASASADTIVVSAAMSLKSAFEEIGALSAFGGSRPAFNFGASGDLLAQIRGGAPADVFAAAAVKDMEVLDAEGSLLPGTRIDFAANEIVLIAPAASKTGVSSFADLVKQAVSRIAMVNPKTGPAGRYAEEVFASAGITDLVRLKLVFAENVRQVLDYVARFEVDAGIVYATDAMTRPQEVTVVAAAPASSHKPVVYPIAVIKWSAHPEAAKAFLAVVRSEAGQAILARYGFVSAPVSR